MTTDGVGTSDPESEALAVLSTSARRARLAGLVPGIALGVAALYPAFWLVSELQWLFIETAFVFISGGAAALAMFGFILAGRRVGEWLWKVRRWMLCDSLAQRYGLTREAVEELANIVS